MSQTSQFLFFFILLCGYGRYTQKNGQSMTTCAKWHEKVAICVMSSRDTKIKRTWLESCPGLLAKQYEKNPSYRHTRVYDNMVPWDLRALGTKRVEIQKIWYQKVVEGQISTVKWKCRHLEREPFITSKGKLLESTFFSCCLLCGARWFVSVLRPRVWSFKWKPLRLKYFVAVSLYAVALYIVALCLNSVVEILKCQRSFKWKPLCNYFSYDTLQYALRIEMNSTEHYFPVLLNFTF